jgi:hypothetical protein
LKTPDHYSQVRTPAKEKSGERKNLGGRNLKTPDHYSQVRTPGKPKSGEKKNLGVYNLKTPDHYSQVQTPDKEKSEERKKCRGIAPMRYLVCPEACRIAVLQQCVER